MRNQLFLGAAIAALVIPGAAYAQETTSIIRGQVTAGGKVVAGAQVVITDVASGTKSVQTTDSSGQFTANGLRAGGPYTVDVTSASGNASITDVYTVVGQPYDLPVDVAEKSTDIVVTASSIKGAGVNSDGPQTVLTQRDIAKVASVNRDIRDIERRSPFATIDLSNSRAVSFAGTNPRFNRFTISGSQVGDTFGLNPDASPTRRGPVPFDAIGQVSVSVAPFDIRQTNFQGGVIDTTLLSGTNEYKVTGFYSQSTLGLQGTRVANLAPLVLPNYKSETYGATVSGPIIKDKLFIMGSFERNTDPRPFTVSQASQINLPDATLAQIQSIASSVYNYTTGGIQPINNNLDEKFVVKVDWNITQGQRLSFSYINSYDALDSLVNSAAPLNPATANNTSSPTATALGVSLQSNNYRLTELLRTGIIQLNSDWTDRLSTEARFVYKAYTRGQDPELGRGFAQFKVCAVPTSVTTLPTDTATSCGLGNPVVYFGPDISRQTNALFTDTYDGSFLLRYQAGNHAFKGLFQYVENRTTNAFLQYSAGAYYFDSIADLQNRNASQFDYQNALTLNPNDTSASFKYGVYSFGLQDDWAVTPELKLQIGARYDLYGSRSPIIGNQNFVNRYGFANTRNFDGLDAFQPRFGFNYKPTSKLSLRGGIGIFSGGTPDIYFSNSYSNTGAIQNRISTIVRATAVPGGSTLTCTAPYTGANAAVCTAALNGVTGTTIPSAVNGYLTTNTASLVTAPTSSVDPNFKLPSYYRATLSADYKLFGINLGADYLFSRTINSITYTDLRSRQIGLLPDGRPRYTFVATPGAGVQTADTNSDVQLRNTTQGRSHVFVLRADKAFDFGLTLGGSYTWQDVKDVSNATSSTPGSLYNNQVVADPNNAVYGISADQTKWQFKYSIGYEHAFFGDYKTIFQLFGETRAGRPYSFTMQDISSGRSAVFGTLGNNNHYLLYVPVAGSDPLVSYDTPATQTALETLIGNTALKNFRGQVAPKNIARARANTRIDLHLEQQIPTFIGKSRVSIWADIENLPNLLNKNWGGLYQTGFPYTSTAVQVQCLSVATPTGTAPGAGVVNTNSTQTCAQYRYSAAQSSISESVNTTQSLYLIRLGIRFTL